jgi:glycosyltransferase involved in cell wall biosynthesis
VPTHGRPGLVRNAVQHVVSQTYPSRVETIVVHDGEEPDDSLVSSDALRPVRVIGNSHSAGLPGARNSGLDVAESEIVGWCDDDDVWHAEKLVRQVGVLLHSSAILAVGAGHRWVAARDPRTTALSVPTREVATQLDLLLDGVGFVGLHSSTVIVRRDTYDKIGFYDESLPGARCEDLEFFLRLTSWAAVPVLRDVVADIRLNTTSGFPAERSRARAEAYRVLLDRWPQYGEFPVARARICRGIAISYSHAGLPADASRWAREALRSDPRDVRALAVLACAAARINVGHLARLDRGIRAALGRPSVTPR